MSRISLLHTTEATARHHGSEYIIRRIQRIQRIQHFQHLQHLQHRLYRSRALFAVKGSRSSGEAHRLATGHQELSVTRGDRT